MPALDEEALIEAVVRIRTAGTAESAAQVHAALTAEGVEASVSDVKKAASKAAKRVGGLASKQQAPAPAPAAAPVNPEKAAKAAKKAEKQANAELKAAEQDMMQAQRKLRAAKSDNSEGAVTIDGDPQKFIQAITMRALAAVLEPGDSDYLALRIEADICALEWVTLANKAGAVKLTEDMVALGGHLQLTRLKEVRGAKDRAAALACYVGPNGQRVEAGGEYQAVDRFLARSQQPSAGDGAGNALDDQD